MSHAVCSTRRHFLWGVAAPAPTLLIMKKKRTPWDRNKALSKGSRGRGIQLMLWKECRGSSRSIAGSGCERTRTPTLPTQALPCLLFCAPCGSSLSLSDAWTPHLHTTGLKSAQTDNTLPHVCPRSLYPPSPSPYVSHLSRTSRSPSSVSFSYFNILLHCKAWSSLPLQL